MPSDWYTGTCGGPRVRYLDDGSIEIEGVGRPTSPLAEAVFQWTDLINEKSAKWRVPAPIIAAIVMMESTGNAGARASDGGMGLMQLTHPYAKAGYSDDELVGNPALNVDLGTKLLSEKFAQYGNNPIHALTSYNAGSPRCGRANPWNLINTDNYVGKAIKYINGAVDSGRFQAGSVATGGGASKATVLLLTAAASYFAASWLLGKYGANFTERASQRLRTTR